MPWIFNYAELSVQEASKLLENAPLCVLPATLQNYKVSFKGASRKWGGAVASLDRKKDCLVYGSAFLVYPDEVRIFDRAYANAEKVVVSIKLTTDDVVKAIAYVQSATAVPGQPSPDYAKAMVRHLKFFWDSENSNKLQLEDFLFVLPKEMQIKPETPEPKQTVVAPETSQLKKRGRPKGSTVKKED